MRGMYKLLAKYVPKFKISMSQGLLCSYHAAIMSGNGLLDSCKATPETCLF